MAIVVAEFGICAIMGGSRKAARPGAWRRGEERRDGLSARGLFSLLISASVVASAAAPVRAFIFDSTGILGRWSNTASGPSGDPGDPVTLSWSIVPDGTLIEPAALGDPAQTSSLVATLDFQFGGGAAGQTIQQRPWFHFFEESFARFGELSGLSYLYEPSDDGAPHGARRGILGVRGDVRIGGISIDGPGRTVGFNSFPDNGEMVLDVGDTELITNSESDFARFRNLIMHEHGHGLGLQHVNSGTDQLLMETFIQSGFTGPQLDEIRAIHFHYGDVNEKSNGGLGNDVAARATSLGAIPAGHSAAVGTDAAGARQTIGPEATDFVSIDHITDVDFYGFDIEGPSTLDAVLRPRGGQFTQSSAPEFTPTFFDANARVDLALEILGHDGAELLALANEQPEGRVEAVQGLQLPAAGRYYARVFGLNDTIQLYELDIAISAPQNFLEADFNEDGEVDGVDLVGWQASFALSADGDADGDLDSDGLDFLTWQRQFGQSPPEAALTGVSVPEPSTLTLLGLLAAAALGRKRRRFSV